MSGPGVPFGAFVGSELPIKVLAVLGGCAVGALLMGWLMQVIAKLAFAQQVPPWPLRGIRILGGGLCGWLVYLWLFGGGGGGIGGPGGFSGAGKSGPQSKDSPMVQGPKNIDKDRANKKDEEAKNKEKDKDAGKDIPPEDTLRIEVLGDAPLRKITKSANFNPEKRYRIEGEPLLRTLGQVKELITNRRARTPPLRRVVIIVYQDSPATDLPQVRGLADWIRDLEPKRGRLFVDLSEPDRNAPVD